MTTDATLQLDLWPAFATKAEALGVTVERASDARAAVDLIRGAAGATGMFVTESAGDAFAEIAKALGAAATAPPRGSHTLTPAAEVVATGRLAVAETGSVLVCERNADRGACMLAERLWLLVPAAAIVPTLDEAMARVAGLVREGAPYATLMSGPSRTADIERTLTIGVHGPRALSIVVLGTAAT